MTEATTQSEPYHTLYLTEEAKEIFNRAFEEETGLEEVGQVNKIVAGQGHNSPYSDTLYTNPGPATAGFDVTRIDANMSLDNAKGKINRMNNAISALERGGLLKPEKTAHISTIVENMKSVKESIHSLYTHVLTLQGTIQSVLDRETSQENRGKLPIRSIDTAQGAGEEALRLFRRNIPCLVEAHKTAEALRKIEGLGLNDNDQRNLDLTNAFKQAVRAAIILGVDRAELAEMFDVKESELDARLAELTGMDQNKFGDKFGQYLTPAPAGP